jgi:hypothetical protein
VISSKQNGGLPHGPRFAHKTHAIFRRCTALDPDSRGVSDAENPALRTDSDGTPARRLPRDERRPRSTDAFGWVGATYVEAPAAVGKVWYLGAPRKEVGCSPLRPLRALSTAAAASHECRRRAVAPATLALRTPPLVGFSKVLRTFLPSFMIQSR